MQLINDECICFVHINHNASDVGLYRTEIYSVQARIFPIAFLFGFSSENDCNTVYEHEIMKMLRLRAFVKMLNVIFQQGVVGECARNHGYEMRRTDQKILCGKLYGCERDINSGLKLCIVEVYTYENICVGQFSYENQ